MGTKKANKKPGANKTNKAVSSMQHISVMHQEGNQNPQVQQVGMQIHYDGADGKGKGSVDIETDVNGKKTKKHLAFDKKDMEKLFHVPSEPDFLHERLMRDFPLMPPPPHAMIMIEEIPAPAFKNKSNKVKRKPLYLNSRRLLRKRGKRTRGKGKRASAYTQTQSQK